MKALCKISGCDKSLYCKGFCKRHYERNRTHGDPLYYNRKTEFGEPLRFLESISKTKEKNCIIWPFTTMKSGYGKLRYKGKGGMRAHRLSLMLSKGNPPSGNHCALHAPLICHNRACVNPNHLRWGTIADNNSDIAIDGTARGRNRKLTDAQVKEIRASNKTLRELAQTYGVGENCLSQLRRGLTYAWVK